MSDVTTQISASTDALIREFDIIAHNLANVSTVGYKRMCNAFSKSLEAEGTGLQTYSPGTIDLTSAFDFSQGSLVETGRPLDFALYGRGFFVIETLEGPLYTRNGVFFTNQNGQIVDSAGRIVAGTAGPITIPSGVALSELNIRSDGTISAGETVIGQFRLVDFQDDENKLVPAGENCYQMTDPDVTSTTAQNIVVKKGYQEASNVKMIDELVDMIMVARLYEANMKSVTATQEATSSILGVAMA
ncbi:MAG: flagellar hook-basal body complex protein [Phycisphaerae bacterium]|nr:flagellar hook basal-body protein [Phycisphaerae bacterium]NIP52888.1 flagellar hook basal-body protein [Phycisphaerae bacterium]NIS51939.1 flagellar hook basal-body protein [Phycisphaerae bacterium]NIU09453.1 flagellar hook basal-body protein [Phycisphaerae bacterium]NIU57186.1 flagellar hook-basal body complex protein [Phycisphaerae bacterium]